MSAATRARKPKPRATLAAERIALEDLTITWKPVRFFHDDTDPETLTLTGKDLPIVLQALAILSPRGNWSKLGDPEDIALDTCGLADLVEALSGSAHLDVNMNAVLWSVSRRIRELAAVGSAAVQASTVALTVTVTRTPPAEVAS